MLKSRVLGLSSGYPQSYPTHQVLPDYASSFSFDDVSICPQKLTGYLSSYEFFVLFLCVTLFDLDGTLIIPK